MPCYPSSGIATSVAAMKALWLKDERPAKAVLASCNVGIACCGDTTLALYMVRRTLLSIADVLICRGAKSGANLLIAQSLSSAVQSVRKINLREVVFAPVEPLSQGPLVVVTTH